MSSVVISGNTSGTITLDAPAVAGTTTLTLPATSGTVALTASPTFTGQATIPTINLTGGQITFPATAVPSANANTLDDYEEGTWTPVDGSGAGLSFTNTAGNCFYTKVGRTVTLCFRLTYPSTANGTTAAIGGLPFTGLQLTQNAQAISFGEQNHSAGLMGILQQNTTSTFFITTNGTTVSLLSNANVSTKDFRGSIVYQTN
jgi:hypothetical protein